MKIADICKLIITCRKNGVDELSYNGLVLKLGSQSHETNEIEKPIYSTANDQPISQGDEIKIFDQSISDDAEQMDLMLSDPFSYETSLIDRFLDKERLDGKENDRQSEPRL